MGVIEPEPTAAAAIFGERIELARVYVSALATDGVLRGLIGPREADRLWTRHVLNSAVITELVPAGARVVDIGTGAGLPGIPLAIARPDVRVDLVEPLERRTVFLAEITDRLGLVNARVVRGRAQDVVEQVGGADVVMSRAVAPLATLAAWSAPLGRPGATVLALKGESAAAELERDSAAVARAGIGDAVVITLQPFPEVAATWVITGSVLGSDRSNGRVSRRRPRSW